METHLIDYPPRGTLCGLYQPKQLYKKRFGTYSIGSVTCKKCLLVNSKARVVKGDVVDGRSD